MKNNTNACNFYAFILVPILDAQWFSVVRFFYAVIRRKRRFQQPNQSLSQVSWQPWRCPLQPLQASDSWTYSVQKQQLTISTITDNNSYANVCCALLGLSGAGREHEISHHLTSSHIISHLISMRRPNWADPRCPRPQHMISSPNSKERRRRRSRQRQSRRLQRKSHRSQWSRRNLLRQRQPEPPRRRYDMHHTCETCWNNMKQLLWLWNAFEPTCNL